MSNDTISTSALAIASAYERTRRPNPGERVCCEWGEWGVIDADVWLWQTGNGWCATTVGEIETWWDGSDDETIASRPDVWCVPIGSVPEGDSYAWISVGSGEWWKVTSNTEAYLAHLAKVAGQKKPKQTKVARYYVIVERDLVEGDYSESYDRGGSVTDGTYGSCVKQLAAELQEGWGAAGIGGFFEIVGREVVNGFSDLASVPVPEADESGDWPMQDNPA